MGTNLNNHDQTYLKSRSC